MEEGLVEATKRPPGIACNRQAEILSWRLDVGLLTAIDLETVGWGWQYKDLGVSECVCV